MAARKADPIRRVVLSQGTTRYRFIVDVGKRPDGKRDQRSFTFDKLGEARAARARILGDRSKGVLVKPTKVTLAEAVEQWLAGKRNIRPGTRRTYADALRLATDRLGHVKLQDLTKAQLDRLVDELLTSGRRIGTKRRQTLSPRSVNVMLTLLGAVLDEACKTGTLARNVARLVEGPTGQQQKRTTWTAEQAGAFLAHVADDRLSAAWQLSLYGLRRGEVLGLRWSDVDLINKTLTVAWSRSSVAGGLIVEGPPKTERSARTLPLDDTLVSALEKLQLSQRDEADALGGSFPPCPECGDHHVVVTEAGQPYQPGTFGGLFERTVKAAGLPVIRLHDARHTCGSIMHERGVPIADISAWLGHSQASFTMAVYVHSQEGALTVAGATLRAAFTPDSERV
jgi:integrase